MAINLNELIKPLHILLDGTAQIITVSIASSALLALITAIIIAAVMSHKKSKTAMDTLQSEHKTAMDTLKTQLNTANNTDTKKAEIAELQSEHKTALNTLQARLDTANNTVGAKSVDITQLQREKTMAMDALQARLQASNSTVGAQKVKIKGLQKKIAQLQEKLSETEEKYSAILDKSAKITAIRATAKEAEAHTPEQNVILGHEASPADNVAHMPTVLADSNSVVNDPSTTTPTKSASLTLLYTPTKPVAAAKFSTPEGQKTRPHAEPSPGMILLQVAKDALWKTGREQFNALFQPPASGPQ